MRQSSRNICRTTDENLPIIYRAQCDCGECSNTLILEKERDLGLTLALYADVRYTEYWCRGWWATLWRRAQIALGILVHGYQEGLECEFIFAGEEAIRDYLAAIESGLEATK